MVYDTVINRGTIIDGSGDSRYRADLGIKNGRIAKITESESPLRGKSEIDAEGAVVAPGFIDIHSHSDWVLPREDHPQILAPLLQQGVTTVVGGNCGFSPFPVSDESADTVAKLSESLSGGRPELMVRSASGFLDQLEEKGVALNLALLIGHGTLRTLFLGSRAIPPDPSILEAMALEVRRALQEGAFGISTGLAFTPGVFAEDEELLYLLRAAAAEEGIWTVHGRTYSRFSPFYRPRVLGKPHNLRDIQRILDLAGAAGVKVNLSHLLFKGRRTWNTHRRALRSIDRAAAGGLDVAFDILPYHWGNSLINVLFPRWFLEDFDRNITDPKSVKRLEREVYWTEKLIGRTFKEIFLLWSGRPELSELEGRSFSEIAGRWGISEIEAYIRIAAITEGRAAILTEGYSGQEGVYERPLSALVRHPLSSFELDTIITSAD